jgi:hypothetical protein
MSEVKNASSRPPAEIVYLYDGLTKGSRDVERINGFSIYTLGQTFARILNYDGDVLRQTAIWPLLEADTATTQLLDGNPFPIGLSKMRVQELTLLWQILLIEVVFGIPESTFE